MSQLNNRFLSVAIIVFIATTLAANGTVRTVAQTVQQVFVTNSTTQPVPVKAVGITAVRAFNTVTAPVWMRDVDSARQPLQRQFNFDITENSYGVAGLTALTVPAGKRFVLEYVSFRMTIPQGQSPQDGPTIEVTNSSGNVEYWLPPPTYSGTLAGTTYVYVTSQSLTLYADPGTTVNVGASRSATTGTARVKVSLSGYLVNVP